MGKGGQKACRLLSLLPPAPLGPLNVSTCSGGGAPLLRPSCRAAGRVCSLGPGSQATARPSFSPQGQAFLALTWTR